MVFSVLVVFVIYFLEMLVFNRKIKRISLSVYLLNWHLWSVILWYFHMGRFRSICLLLFILFSLTERIFKEFFVLWKLSNKRFDDWLKFIDSWFQMPAVFSGNLLLKFVESLEVLYGGADIAKVKTSFLLVMLKIDVAPGGIFIAIEALSIFIDPVFLLVEAWIANKTETIDDKASVGFVAPLAKTKRHLILVVHALCEWTKLAKKIMGKD